MTEQLLHNATSEQEQRQQDALRAVNLISREAGRALPIYTAETQDEIERIGIESGVYVLDPAVTAKGEIRDTDFTLNPRMLSGAADSAHAVLIGNLRTDFRSGEVSDTAIVAKCYRKREREDRYTRVMREVMISRDMAQRGELALEPVAVAIAPPEVAEGSVALLTRFREGLFTLDSYPWGRGATDENVASATLAAATVGHFNTLGYAHNDAKIKNVASTPDGTMGMIDFETTTHIDVTHPLQAAEAVHSDLGLLLHSLSQKGLFTVEPGTSSYEKTQRISSTIQHICSEGYLPNWEDASPEVQMAVFNAVEEVALAEAHKHLLIPVSI